jgi:hypothetical protein
MSLFFSIFHLQNVMFNQIFIYLKKLLVVIGSVITSDFVYGLDGIINKTHIDVRKSHKDYRNFVKFKRVTYELTHFIMIIAHFDTI